LGAVRFSNEKILRFAAQLGLEGVVINTPGDVPGEDRWEVADLVRVREHVETFGLRVEAVENTPIGFYRDVILAGPRSDEQLENYCHTVRSIGAAGIPILGFHWMASEVWRTDLAYEGRGGARVTAFNLANLPDPDAPTLGKLASVDDLWRSFERFLDRVLPVAEEAGVRLALHPDDPPVPSLGGIARIFHAVDGLEHALELAGGSEAFGLEFCLGTTSSMGPGADAILRRFAEEGKIAYVHFRDVRGHVPSFEECFVDEGNFDAVSALQGLIAAGYDGFVIDDHVPLMDDDPPIVTGWIGTEYAYVGHAFTVGYLRGLLDVLQHTHPDPAGQTGMRAQFEHA
jgi:mannonate dehydratase